MNRRPLPGSGSPWQAIDAQGARDIAVVGICKHAGKTTALGRLLADADALGRRVAVLSVGVDGERFDRLLGVAKPQVFAPRGALVATAVGAQDAGAASVRWLAPAGFGSPLGDVWYGEVLAPGPVVLAGVRQLAHLRAARAWLRAAGAQHVLVDGALSRAVGVHPDVCDGVVLAAGAAAGALAEVVRQTRGWVERLTLPACEGMPALDALRAAPAGGVYAVRDARGGVQADLRDGVRDGAWDGAQADVREDVREGAGPDVRGPAPDHAALLSDPMVDRSYRLFFFSGSLTDGDLLTLATRDGPVTAVVRTPLHLFAGDAARARFLRAGHSICALTRSALVSLAVNPATPFGPPLDRQVLHAALRPLVPPGTPLWDAYDDV